MKVKELIALLSLRDPEAVVRVPYPDWESWDGEYRAVEDVVSVDLTQSLGTKVVELS